MKNVYWLSLLVAVFFTACTAPTAVSTTKTTPKAETNTEITFETVTLKGDIASPRKEMRGKIGSESLTVNYGSPSVKGRTVWGELVPYGKVWRTGANEASTIEISKDLKVEGKVLPAGKYAFFTIPEENGEWTVIFNNDFEQWGAYKYDKNKDALRVKASAKLTSKNQETMEFGFDNNRLVMKWEKLWLFVDIGM